MPPPPPGWDCPHPPTLFINQNITFRMPFTDDIDTLLGDGGIDLTVPPGTNR